MRMTEYEMSQVVSVGSVTVNGEERAAYKTNNSTNYFDRLNRRMVAAAHIAATYVERWNKDA